MPSVSKKQRNFMAAAAHDPAFAKKVGISQKVAKEFNQADKGKKFGGGGMARTKRYEEGGLTFADMDAEDRSEAARKAMEDLDARQAAKSAEASKGASSVKPNRRAVTKVNPGDAAENRRDLELQGADTGYSDTEARRNLSRAGTEHASGRPKTDAAKYNEAKAGSGGPSREIKPAKKGAVSDLIDTFRKAPRLMKSGGVVKKASGGAVRGCGTAQRGKTKGRMV